MSQIQDIESQLPSISSKVTSANLGIGNEVKTAEDQWEGKTENSPDVYPILKSYWESVGWDESRWTPSSQPWSAAFVSYLLRDHGFPGSSLHVNYVLDAIQGKGGWQAFSIPKNKDKLVVSVGDVLVAPRSGSYSASHGDVVYQIRNGAADVIGGNLSDTVGHGSIGLNSDGTISNPKSYLVLLKRNPTSPSAFLAKRIGFWSLIVGVVGIGGYLGYQYYKGNQLKLPYASNPTKRFGSPPPVGLAEQELRNRGYEDIVFIGKGSDVNNGESLKVQVFQANKNDERFQLRVARLYLTERIVIQATRI